jgi:hypothetical protein
MLVMSFAASAHSAPRAAVGPKLTVSVAGQGTVTSAPRGISCPSKCTARGKAGARFALTAKAGDGWKLRRWSGACSGSGRCVVTLRGAKTVRATFVAKPVPPPPPTTTTTTTTPSGGGNLALGKTITASSRTTTDYPATAANDGNVETYWESINNTFPSPQWLQVDLGAATSVSKVVIHLPPDAAWATRKETIAVSGATDGVTFATIVPATAYTFDPSTQNTVTITFAATSVRQLRLTFTANTGWPAAQVSEFEIYA